MSEGHSVRGNSLKSVKDRQGMVSLWMNDRAVKKALCVGAVSDRELYSHLFRSRQN